MPLIYIAHSAAPSGIDLATPNGLQIQFSATSYRATLSIPVLQYASNSVLLNITNTQLPANTWYASPSLFLTLGYPSVPAGDKLYAADSQFLSVASSSQVTYPNKTYTSSDVLLAVRGGVSTQNIPFSASATTDVLINVRAITPTLSTNVFKGYASTVYMQSVSRTLSIPLQGYA